MALVDLLGGNGCLRNRTTAPIEICSSNPALNVMSYWEQNWRRNLKLITVDEVPPAQQIQVSRWLKQRTELLLGQIQPVDAESLVQEFDDYEDACC